ncbi:MAG: hypothetical protein R3194_07425, partial [Limnobacter sp.]|nr:hypothetical protein [Limnobacter sp.]
LECSECGAEIWPDDFPRPPGVPLERWMQTFPSFGFVFSVAPAQVNQMKQIFSERDLLCSEVGQVTEGPKVWLKHQDETELLWDFSTMSLLGCGQLNQTNVTVGEVNACRSV